MPKWIKPSRVRTAISALSEWRSSSSSQGAMHLWPLLALIEHGVNESTFVPFKEQDDRDFWDRFMRFQNEPRPYTRSPGAFTEDYYIEPLTLQLKPSDYFHRGPATVRVRTFLNSWHAAEQNQDTGQWKLALDYASIFESKVLSKGGTVQRIPIVDLGVFLFRSEEFEDDADVATLQTKFGETFPFRQADFDRLFEFRNEPEENVFMDAKPSDEELNGAIREAVFSSSVPVLDTQRDDNERPIDDENQYLIDVRRLLRLSSSGIIFRGCPGTGKTWYALQIAKKLVVSPENDIFQVQFHPSYGYEDFIEGYRPDTESRSGFSIVDRIFLDAIKRAQAVATPVVFIIDEINRGDPARAFGELLTFMEHGYRGVEFPTALSGKKVSVPMNLIVFGTMNPHDRSITQFDMALMRRFDHIDLLPDAEMVEGFLANSAENQTDFSSNRVNRIVLWFVQLQKMLGDVGIGHTYFKDVKTLEDLRTVWRFRMFPYCANILELEETRLGNVKNSFDAMMRDLDNPHTESLA